MKNFWLKRRKQNKINTIAKLLESVIKQKLVTLTGLNGVKKQWQQQKKDTKTQQ